MTSLQSTKLESLEVTRRSFQLVCLIYYSFRTLWLLTLTDWVPRDDFHPDETDTIADFKSNKFLDLGKPLLVQVWRANWTKEYYLSQVHNPRHLKESARMFESNFLEVSAL
jgi:hypothetical protein